MSNKVKLKRSRTDRMIAGVCGGLGDYFDIDPTIVRLVFVVMAFIDGIGLLIYIVMAIVVPEDKKYIQSYSSKGFESEKSEDTNVMSSIKTDSNNDQVDTTSSSKESAKSDDSKEDSFPRWIGIGLVIVGIILLLDRMNLAWWLNWNILWPLLIILIGLWLLLKRK